MAPGGGGVAITSTAQGVWLLLDVPVGLVDIAAGLGVASPIRQAEIAPKKLGFIIFAADACMCGRAKEQDRWTSGEWNPQTCSCANGGRG